MARTVIIAADMIDAQSHARLLGMGKPTAIVTPRSRDAVRGRIIDEIVVTPRMIDDPRLPALRAEVEPAMASSAQEADRG